MASDRRVAHVGLVLACLVLLSTLTILFQGAGAPLVGQEPIETTATAATAGDAVRETTARAINVAVMNK